MAAPRPSRRSARSMVAWRSALATTRSARRADQPVALDVPTDGGQHMMAGGGEPDGVGGLGAGDEPDRRRGRQPEQVLQPTARDLLDDGGGGRGDDLERVSGPSRRSSGPRRSPHRARRRSQTRSSGVRSSPPAPDSPRRRVRRSRGGRSRGVAAGSRAPHEHRRPRHRGTRATRKPFRDSRRSVRPYAGAVRAAHSWPARRAGHLRRSPASPRRRNVSSIPARS